MLYAKEYLRPIGIGVTKPHLIRADDNKLYVVKLKNNKLGIKVLINEFLAGRLGDRLDLCFPKSDVMMLTDDFIKKSRRLRHLKVKAGLHFASEYLQRSRFLQRSDLSVAENKHEFAGVILFDHVMQNEDRTLNSRNMLVRRENRTYKMYAIDNSHLFGSGRWRNERLLDLVNVVHMNKRRAYGSLIRHYLCADDFAQYVKRFSEITPEEIYQLVNEIPTEWLDDEETRQLIKEFLVNRFVMVDEIAAHLVELIPDEDRRTYRD